MFSVKFAYGLARDYEAQESIRGVPACSTINNEEKGSQWKKLWSISLPNKVLHFLWRVATDSLPMRTKLRKRGM